jgi:hypothetical protein
VVVGGGQNTPFKLTTTGTSAVFPAFRNNPVGKSFSWSVTAINKTGQAKSTSRTFETRIPVAPPVLAPRLSARQAGAEIKCEGAGFASSEPVNDFGTFSRFISV